MSNAPTAEQFTKGQFREEETSPVLGSPKRYRRVDSSELDRLLFADQITPDEHCTLEKFQSDLRSAGMIFSVRSSMEPSSTQGGSQFMADNAFMRVKRITEQMEILKANLTEQERTFILAMLTSDLRLSPGSKATVKKTAALLAPLYEF